jgi:hypothetical protein
MSVVAHRGGRIIELMQVPEAERDTAWLQQMLGQAVKLELSTLPPYLCAWWSIVDSTTDPNKDPLNDPATIILSIIFEEMYHMSLACNMLTAIGGTPEINTGFPTYPGPLPGGVLPDLTVYLSGLTKDLISDVFMQIEKPESFPTAADATYGSIGAFYDAIATGLKTIQPTITGQHQVVTTIGPNDEPVTAVESIDNAVTFVGYIKEQGEGTSATPDAPDFGDELAHYYKFGEIYNGKHYVKTGNVWGWTGPPEIPFPSTHPMARVPPGGWRTQSESNPNPDVPSNVIALLDQFNQSMLTVLNQLQAAWTSDDGVDHISPAVDAMFALNDPAVSLVQIERTDGPGNYGPDFYLGI